MKDTSAVLDVDAVAFGYDEEWLLEACSAQFSQGDWIWLQGENGAGKSTFLRLISGLLRVDEGAITWGGNSIYDALDYRRDLLWCGFDNPLTPELTLVENLEWLCQLHGHSPVNLQETLIQFGLKDLQTLPCDQLSSGQQRRVSLSRLLLMPTKKIWLLDEPFNGLDSHFQSVLLQVMADKVQQGGLVIFTSHHLAASDSELASLQTWVLQSGRLHQA